jgi:hypothetical protein
MTQQAMQRYQAAAHAMQSGVAAKMGCDPSETTPKHLRTGVNSAMVEHSALAELLMAKGVFTEDEYQEALATGMEREVRLYEDWLSQHTGVNITLG